MFNKSQQFTELKELFSLSRSEAKAHLIKSGVKLKDSEGLLNEFNRLLDVHVDKAMTEIEAGVKLFVTKGEYIIALRQSTREINEMHYQRGLGKTKTDEDFDHQFSQLRYLSEFSGKIEKWIEVVLQLHSADLPLKR